MESLLLRQKYPCPNNLILTNPHKQAMIILRILTGPKRRVMLPRIRAMKQYLIRNTRARLLERPSDKLGFASHCCAKSKYCYEGDTRKSSPWFFLPHSTRPCTCCSQLERPSSPLACHAQTTLHVSVKEANGRENGDESNYKSINVESDYHL